MVYRINIGIMEMEGEHDMHISMSTGISQVTKNEGYQTKRVETEDFSSILETNKNSEDECRTILGMASITKAGGNTHYGMLAFYSDESTNENPIIEIKSQLGIWKVSINDVNPTKATRMEMFALCAYEDERNPEKRSTFGNYQTLIGSKSMVHMLNPSSSEFNLVSNENQFRNEKVNWIEGLSEVKIKHLERGYYKQYLNVKNLIDLITKYI